jgi:hypothetical protein
MRFRETGDKMLERDREKAKEFYDKAFSLYSMFWAINFDLEEDEELVEASETEDNGETEKARDRSAESSPDHMKGLEESTGSSKGSWLDSVKSTVKSAVDCCKEI